MPGSSLPMRWARPEDAERIAAYHHQCWQAAFASILPSDVVAAAVPKLDRWHNWLDDATDFVTVVAIDGNDVAIGHTTVLNHQLVHLFVAPEHQRNGVGRALLEVGERLIERSGHPVAELHTRVGNEPAIALYRSRGWEMTDGIVDDPQPDGSTHPEHVMIKNFAATSHVATNRQAWNEDAASWVDRGRRSWAAAPHWGEMAIPEAQVHALPDVSGRDVIELGCGTGYVSSWCLAAGARCVVGLDNSPAQLRSAQLLQGEFERPFPLVWADAEHLPIAADSFDVAINEYGAALWCDPHKWIAEATRVLRPGGTLMFVTRSSLLSLTAPDFEDERTSTRLLRPLRGMHRMEFPDTEAIEFALSPGDWISLLTGHGFVVDRLIELYAPDAVEGGPERYSYFDADWARRWPAEEIWIATLR